MKFNEIPVDGDRQLREKMTKLAGGAHTVPQIWIGDSHVGGCTELMGLDRSGALDKMLEG